MKNPCTVRRETSQLPDEHRWTDIDGTEYSALEEGAPTELGAMPAACREIFRLAKERDELLVRLDTTRDKAVQAVDLAIRNTIAALHKHGIYPEIRRAMKTVRQQLEEAVEAKRYTASRDGGNGERIMLNREWDILDAKDMLAAISEILG